VSSVAARYARGAKNVVPSVSWADVNFGMGKIKKSQACHGRNKIETRKVLGMELRPLMDDMSVKFGKKGPVNKLLETCV
jgi:hypothetical protein